MKKIGIVLLFSAPLLFYSCKGQEKEKKQEMEIRKMSQPKVDIVVNKKYDEFGNLIGYDSTYSSFYTTYHTDKALTDSILDSFEPFMKEKYPDLFSISLDNFFFKDSILQSDFFYDDYFENRYKLNRMYFEKMMNQMDSIKNEYFMLHSKQFKN